MTVNNISYPICPLSTRIDTGYDTKIIPFFFLVSIWLKYRRLWRKPTNERNILLCITNEYTCYMVSSVHIRKYRYISIDVQYAALYFKCNHFGQTLFGLFRIIMCKFASKSVTINTLCWNFINIISIPDVERFSETAVGCTASCFVSYSDVTIYIFDIIYYLFCMCIDFYDLSARCGCWFGVYIRRIIYTFLNMCSFDYTAVSGSGTIWPVNRLTTPVAWL